MKDFRCVQKLCILTCSVLVGIEMYADKGEPVIGVTLSKSSLALQCGENDTLRATVLPEGEASSSVVWRSDDESVAVVADGIVRALSVGAATVTVTTLDGGYKAACTINVRAEGEEAQHGMHPGAPGGMPPGGPGGMPPRGGHPGKTDSMTPPDMPPGGGPGGMPPGGRPGNGGPGGGWNESDSSDATDAGAYMQTEGEYILSGKTYTSSTADANAVKVSGGTLTLADCTITKEGGNTSNFDGSSFYGLNSAVLARKGGTVTLQGGSIETNAIGANGIVAYGGMVQVSDMTIHCANRLSRGIHATGGGSIIASNLHISTEEANSSVIALDRGGGTVNVTGGTYTTAGRDCAVLYSTGDLTVNNITGSSKQGEIGVIEGDNFIAINNSHLTSHADASSRGLMILQSGSGDAGDGLNGVITVAGGSLTMTDDEASLIEIVTNVTGKVTLDGVKTTIPSGILMMVDYNKRWTTNGATGVLVLSGEGTTYQGSIVADSYSSAMVTVNSGVVWEGAYDKENTAKSSSLVLNGGTWTLTGDSYVGSIILKNQAVINKNGYTLTCPSVTQDSGTINE